MRFHLSTLLIVTTALGVLFAQCGYFLNESAAAQAGTSSAGRYLVVGLIPFEVFTLLAWMLVRRGPFPWRALVILAIVVVVAVAVFELLAGAQELRERIALAILIPLVLGQTLAFGIAGLFAIYSMIIALERFFAGAVHHRLSQTDHSPN